MDESSKVARLFRTPAEELVKIEPSEWQDTFSDIHGEDLRLLSNSLIKPPIPGDNGNWFCP